jgi:hypothetical protein
MGVVSGVGEFRRFVFEVEVNVGGRPFLSCFFELRVRWVVHVDLCGGVRGNRLSFLFLGCFLVFFQQHLLEQVIEVIFLGRSA